MGGGGGGGADPVLTTCVRSHPNASHASNSGGKSPGRNSRRHRATAFAKQLEHHLCTLFMSRDA